MLRLTIFIPYLRDVDMIWQVHKPWNIVVDVINMYKQFQRGKALIKKTNEKNAVELNNSRGICK